MKITNVLWYGLVLSASISSTSAAIVNVTAITGHDGGNWPSWHGHLTDMVNGSDASILDSQTGDTITPGMDTSADPSDPTQWTWSGGYSRTWHANSVLSGAAGGKLGWVIIDFGSVIDNLENAHFWGSGQASAGEHVNGLNIHYSSGTGIDALPAMPQSQSTTGDYDFSSGDWALLKGHNMATSANSQAGPLDSTATLDGISARYIGIEITSLHGTTPGNRMTIGQIEFTNDPIPEPSATLLGVLGTLCLLRRRR